VRIKNKYFCLVCTDITKNVAMVPAAKASTLFALLVRRCKKSVA
jgi:hypothetical protein